MDPLLYTVPLFTTFQYWARFFSRTSAVKAQSKAFRNLHVLPFLLTSQFENVFLTPATSQCQGRPWDIGGPVQGKKDGPLYTNSYRVFMFQYGEAWDRTFAQIASLHNSIKISNTTYGLTADNTHSLQKHIHNINLFFCPFLQAHIHFLDDTF